MAPLNVPRHNVHDELRFGHGHAALRAVDAVAPAGVPVAPAPLLAEPPHAAAFYEEALFDELDGALTSEDATAFLAIFDDAAAAAAAAVEAPADALHPLPACVPPPSHEAAAAVLAAARA
eukprot:CAMPEP_0198427202 /NCGR_PEP_ID=MMETSP1452-20131203/5753_1 /TAXON_ID=1181717 /ORGANISM="Synchroma pusillum, Strain CCMP3072" /LENGTH=119 /DNA_ID=CAMNT_0044147581 /DNA_START=78 /DNA_END=434 /DNA_ORIENTATION=-